jgi:hypothetical protein
MVKIPEHIFNTVGMRIDEACESEFNAGERRDYLGMSQLGYPCELRIWLNYNGYDRGGDFNKAKMHRVFAMGHYIEEFVKNLLVVAGYVISDEQLEFTDFDGRFRGHCDGIIDGITKRKHILEIKSASSHNFMKMKKESVVKCKPEYEAQIQLYMGYAELERGIFVVMCKNTQEIYTERVHFDKEKFEYYKKKAQRIIEAETPPNMDKKSCYFCDYRGEICDSVQKQAKCNNCMYNLPLSKFPISQLLEKHNLQGCLIGNKHFCGAGETYTDSIDCAKYGEA